MAIQGSPIKFTVKTVSFACFEIFAHCGGRLAHLIRKISALREIFPFFLVNSVHIKSEEKIMFYLLYRSAGRGNKMRE